MSPYDRMGVNDSTTNITTSNTTTTTGSTISNQFIDISSRIVRNLYGIACK